MSRIDFRKVRLVPIGSVLSHYGVEFTRREKVLVVKQCPLPSHRSKEVGTFKVGIEDNLWTCYSSSCREAADSKGGDVVDFMCLMENLNPLEAAKKLAELFCVNGNVLKAGEVLVPLNQNSPPKEGSNGSNDAHQGFHNNKPLGFALQGLNPEHPMIQERGISVETAKSFGVGYFSGKGTMSNRVVFPLHEDGQLVGYLGRWGALGDDPPKEIEADCTIWPPKWRIGKGIVKSMLFGLERCDPACTLTIFESPWAVLYYFERGLKGCALLGCELTEGQEKRLEPYHNLCLALDDDSVGREAARKLSERLNPRHVVFRSFLRE